MRGPDAEGVSEGNVGGSGEPGHGGARVDDDAAVSRCVEAEERGGEAAHRRAADADPEELEVVEGVELGVFYKRSEARGSGNSGISENDRGGFGRSGTVDEAVREFLVEPATGLDRKR